MVRVPIKNYGGAVHGGGAGTINTYIDRARTKYAAHGRPAPTKSDMVKRALEDGLIELSDLDGTYTSA